MIKALADTARDVLFCPTSVFIRVKISDILSS